MAIKVRQNQKEQDFIEGGADSYDTDNSTELRPDAPANYKAININLNRYQYELIIQATEHLKKENLKASASQLIKNAAIESAKKILNN